MLKNRLLLTRVGCVWEAEGWADAPGATLQSPSTGPGSPICPFYPSTADTGRPSVTDVSLFNPPAPAASARVRSVAAVRLPPVAARLPPRRPPPCTAATHGVLSEARTRTGGRAEVGGRPGTRRCARWSPAFDCTRRKETLTALLQYYEQLHVVSKHG